MTTKINFGAEGQPWYDNELDKADDFKSLYVRLIGFRESLKMAHLSTNSWQEHLATDKVYDELDDLIDTLGEVYFLPRGISLRNMEIPEVLFDGKNPAVAAMVINKEADALAAKVEDNALINYLNGLSQDMQRYVGWLRLGMADIVQDREMNPNTTVESTPKSRMRAFAESVLKAEAFGGQKITIYPNATYSVSGYATEDGYYNEQRISGLLGANRFLEIAKKAAKKLKVELVRIEAVQCDNTSGEPRAIVGGNQVAVRLITKDKQTGEELDDGWRRAEYADGKVKISQLKTSAIAAGIMPIACYNACERLYQMIEMEKEYGGDQPEKKGLFGRLFGK